MAAMVVTTIIADREFLGPYRSIAALEELPGVYVVADTQVKPLDVGQAQNVKERVASHDRVACWEQHATGAIVFYVRWLAMSTQGEREQFEKEMRNALEPPCGSQ